MTFAQCQGFTIGKFRIPPFELNEGEFISIGLYGGQHFYDLSMQLIDLFCGKKTISELEMHQNMRFVEHFKESRLKGIFCPMTVEKYVRTKGKAGSEVLDRIYEVDDRLQPKTRINTLPGNPKKWLSLFTTLSHSDRIVFDLVGQDPVGCDQTIEFVNEYVEKGGSAILLDDHNDSKVKCTKYLIVEVEDF